MRRTSATPCARRRPPRPRPTARARTAFRQPPRRTTPRLLAILSVPVSASRNAARPRRIARDLTLAGRRIPPRPAETPLRRTHALVERARFAALAAATVQRSAAPVGDRSALPGPARLRRPAMKVSPGVDEAVNLIEVRAARRAEAPENRLVERLGGGAVNPVVDGRLDVDSEIVVTGEGRTVREDSLLRVRE